VWVSDTWGYTVWKFDGTQKPVSSPAFGVGVLPGPPPNGGYNLEYGIAVSGADATSAAGHLYVVDYYEKIIRELDQSPIIMGHSFGGTFTQILLDRGLGAAGVGIASATVKGVRELPLSTIKATAPALNPFKKGQAVPLTGKEFHYAFANTMSRADSDAIYQRYHVPAASTVLREGAFANFHRDAPTTVDFHHQRAPLLFIAFTDDHIVPPKASRHNEEKYDDSVSITEFIEFPGRPHFPGAPGWEEVADYALRWAVEHASHSPADHPTHP